MHWKAELTRKAEKQADRLPRQIRSILIALMHEIRMKGPVRGDWPNYGKLNAKRHDCHLKKGHPTYVAVWEESEQEVKLIEVTYVGTHEKAPY